MTRPAVEVADLLRKQGDRFIDQSPWLNFQQLTVLRAITRCRTAALGGHIDQCSQCGHQAISYNSCRNRHCPKCQAHARQRWLAAREKELLGVPYFHVVFTLPHEWNPLCRHNPRVMTICCFVPAPRPCWKSRPILNDSARRLGSSRSSIPGGKTCSCIPTYTAWFQPGDSPLTIKAGFTRNTTSSCPWRCSVASFVPNS